MIRSFQTDWSGQIVQTQIRLLLEEQFDQGLHYLQYCLSLGPIMTKPLFPVLGWLQQSFLVSENLGTLRYILGKDDSSEVQDGGMESVKLLLKEAEQKYSQLEQEQRAEKASFEQVRSSGFQSVK